MYSTSDDLNAVLAFTNASVGKRPAHLWLSLHGTMEGAYWQARQNSRAGATEAAIEAGIGWVRRNLDLL